jgi:hypothetical protein
VGNSARLQVERLGCHELHPTLKRHSINEHFFKLVRLDASQAEVLIQGSSLPVSASLVITNSECGSSGALEGRSPIRESCRGGRDCLHPLPFPGYPLPPATTGTWVVVGHEARAAA